MASHALAVKTEIAVADCLSTLLSFLADDDEGDDDDDHHHYFNEYHKLFFTLHINMYQGAQIMPQLLFWHHFCFYDFGVFFQNIRTLKIFQHL